MTVPSEVKVVKVKAVAKLWVISALSQLYQRVGVREIALRLVRSQELVRRARRERSLALLGSAPQLLARVVAAMLHRGVVATTRLHLVSAALPWSPQGSASSVRLYRVQMLVVLHPVVAATKVPPRPAVVPTRRQQVRVAMVACYRRVVAGTVQLLLRHPAVDFLRCGVLETPLLNQVGAVPVGFCQAGAALRSPRPFAPPRTR